MIPTKTQSHLALAAIIGSLGVLMLGASLLIQSLSTVGILSRATIDSHAAERSDGQPKRPEHQPEYQLIQLGELRRDQFLIDKSCGRTWVRVCVGQMSGADCDGRFIWQEMYVEGVTPDSSAAAENYRQDDPLGIGVR